MPYISRADWEATKPRTADKVAIDGVSLHANAGFDSFGRPKAQPVKIDVVLSLSQPTSSAATADALDHSTVHYGELGKAIIAHVQRTAAEWQQPHDFVNGVAETVMTFAEVRSAVEAVDVGVCFCKASLAGGGGWSLALSLDAKQGGVCVEYSLKGFRMPILIGVNKHERAMKQVVVVDVGIDRLGPLVANECYQVEQILAKTLEESTFETLEALAETTAANIIKFFILAKGPHPAAPATHSNPTVPIPGPAGVRIRAGKPLAIAQADMAVVEIYRSAEPDHPFGRRMAAELGSKRPQIPFPLQGRLDDFLQSWKQD